MRNEKTFKSAFKYWLIGGLFGTHNIYLNKFKKSDHLYLLTSLILTIVPILTLIGSINVEAWINNARFSRSLSVYTSPIICILYLLYGVTIIKWLFDGITLKSLVNKANEGDFDDSLDCSNSIMMSGCSLAYMIDIDDVEANGGFLKAFWYNILLISLNVMVLLIPILMLASRNLLGMVYVMMSAMVLPIISMVIAIISIIRGFRAFKDYQSAL